jgi:hypothetical protein
MAIISECGDAAAGLGKASNLSGGVANSVLFSVAVVQVRACNWNEVLTVLADCYVFFLRLVGIHVQLVNLHQGGDCFEEVKLPVWAGEIHPSEKSHSVV